MDSLGASLFELRPHKSLSLFKQIEYIPSTFDIHYSTFDIRFFIVSFIDQTGCPLGGGSRSYETTPILTPRQGI
ncbi:hypothetical protein D1AOALGA4SA_1393 [Olavius algarvensis Delta 1 endosymbiont]|nr:hypothetical protein D1AOALGA4SA_1393 [Olavius algarvensis Delta 1 endosymbiont]